MGKPKRKGKPEIFIVRDLGTVCAYIAVDRAHQKTVEQRKILCGNGSMSISPISLLLSREHRWGDSVGIIIERMQALSAITGFKLNIELDKPDISYGK